MAATNGSDAHAPPGPAAGKGGAAAGQPAAGPERALEPQPHPPALTPDQIGAYLAENAAMLEAVQAHIARADHRATIVHALRLQQNLLFLGADADAHAEIRPYGPSAPATEPFDVREAHANCAPAAGADGAEAAPPPGAAARAAPPAAAGGEHADAPRSARRGGAERPAAG